MKNTFLKTKTGSIYQVLQNEKGLHLRTGNTYKKTTLQDVREKFKSEIYAEPTQEEIDAWLKRDAEYINGLTKKMMKRIITAQLLIEQNDELIQDNLDDKYIKSLMQKSNKHLERVVGKHYDNLYAANNVILHNITKSQDSVLSNLSKLNPEDMLVIDKFVKEFVENPEKYRPEKFELEKLQ
jgi:hypothetical protein